MRIEGRKGPGRPGGYLQQKNNVNISPTPRRAIQNSPTTNKQFSNKQGFQIAHLPAQNMGTKSTGVTERILRNLLCCQMGSIGNLLCDFYNSYSLALIHRSYQPFTKFVFPCVSSNTTNLKRMPYMYIHSGYTHGSVSSILTSVRICRYFQRIRDVLRYRAPRNITPNT